MAGKSAIIIPEARLWRPRTPVNFADSRRALLHDLVRRKWIRYLLLGPAIIKLTADAKCRILNNIPEDIAFGSCLVHSACEWFWRPFATYPTEVPVQRYRSLRSWTLALALCATPLAIAACGGDDDNSNPGDTDAGDSDTTTVDGGGTDAGVGEDVFVDSDSDGVADGEDNCPEVENADQADMDEDGEGDLCDSDRDGDGADNDADNCPDDPNADQADADQDGAGDACDPDFDNDGVADEDDNCPEIENADQADMDEDGEGDVCDEDLDGDGVANTDDNCPEHANPDQEDWDIDVEGNNGQGDACALEVDLGGNWAGEWRTDVETSPGNPALFGSVTLEAPDSDNAIWEGFARFTGAPCIDGGPITFYLADNDGDPDVIDWEATLFVSDEVVARQVGSVDAPPPEGCPDWQMTFAGTIRNQERLNGVYAPQCLPPPCSDNPGTVFATKID